MSIRLGCIAGVLSLLLGCAPIERTHGYVPIQSDLDLLLIGADTKGSVEETIGRAADTGTFESDAWYYVESTVKTFLYFEPEVVERRVMEFEFDSNDVLTAINQYGLEDGRVINLQTRVTPTDGRRTSVLQNLFGNIGAIAPPLPGS